MIRNIGRYIHATTSCNNSKAMTMNTTPPPAEQGGKLSLFPLTALVIGAIIGSGIFSLPQNMASGAGPEAILIAWAITFVGMFCLARVFQQLALLRPDINTGPYGYARERFGDFIGFSMAWGMWVSACMGNSGYLVGFWGTLSGFPGLEFFGDGTTTPAVICALVMLWAVHFMILRGVQTAAFINALVTLAKIIPVLMFIAFTALAFKVDTFNLDFGASLQLGGLLAQVKTTMLFTVWVFIGIESASIYASRARSMRDVSLSTSLGFIVTFLLYAGVSILSLGILPQAELAALKNPSMAGVLAHVLGPWGGTLINLGMIISVGGAFLAWTLLASEIMFNTSRGDHGTGPHVFKIVNRTGTPSGALWLSNILVTACLLFAWLEQAGYNVLIQLATAMTLAPYLLASLFALNEAAKTPKPNPAWLLVSAVSSVYGFWLVYAAGWNFWLASMLLYALGIIFFLRGRRQDNLPFITKRWEGAIVILIVLLAVVAGYSMYTGHLHL